MSLTWPGKDERERLELEAFLTTYRDLPHGSQLRIVRKRERPDYELATDEKRRVGLELTSVYRSDRSVPDEHLPRLNDRELYLPSPHQSEFDLLLDRTAERVREKVRSAQSFDRYPHMILAVYHNDHQSIHLRGAAIWRGWALKHAELVDAISPFKLCSSICQTSCLFLSGPVQMFVPVQPSRWFRADGPRAPRLALLGYCGAGPPLNSDPLAA